MSEYVIFFWHTWGIFCFMADILPACFTHHHYVTSSVLLKIKAFSLSPTLFNSPVGTKCGFLQTRFWQFLLNQRNSSSFWPSMFCSFCPSNVSLKPFQLHFFFHLWFGVQQSNDLGDLFKNSFSSRIFKLQIRTPWHGVQKICKLPW